MHNSPAAEWLTSHAHLLPPRGTALDLACGRGRHALWLAAQGLAVTAIDRDPGALADLRETAAAHGVDVRTQQVDLEGVDPTLGEGLFDLIVCVHYLHRPLFPTVRAALRSGGLLVYETFTRKQAEIGRPTNSAFLLEPGELLVLVGPLDVLNAREGFHDGRHVASVVARKP